MIFTFKMFVQIISYTLLSEMPILRNQAQVKCKLSFAEMASQLGSLETLNLPCWIEGQNFCSLYKLNYEPSINLYKCM